MSKRTLPGRELLYTGTLMDKLPFSRLPTNLSILRRPFFITETGINTTLDEATVIVKNELLEIWRYAGYGDILYDRSHILRKIKSLVNRFKYLRTVPVSRRSADFFVRKKQSFKELLSKIYPLNRFPTATR